jgi:phosphatidylinositol glycan class H protein
MERQAWGVSTGVYRYAHRHEGGADIHDVFVEKSMFRMLFSCIGATLLLGSVCRALLSKVLLLEVHSKTPTID